MTRLSGQSQVKECFNSQSPTKGTAMLEAKQQELQDKVSILSPQQRGLQLGQL